MVLQEPQRFHPIKKVEIISKGEAVLQVPLIIAAQALHAAWEAWLHSRGKPTSYIEPLHPSNDSLKSGQQKPASRSSASTTPVDYLRGISSRTPTTAQTSACRPGMPQSPGEQSVDGRFPAGIEREQISRETTNCSSQEHSRVSPHLEITASPGLEALKQNPQVSSEQFCTGFTSSSQGDLRQDDIQHGPIQQPAHSPSQSSTVQSSVAITASGGWASGVVVHASGLVLTVAHAIRPSPLPSDPALGDRCSHKCFT